MQALEHDEEGGHYVEQGYRSDGHATDDAEGERAVAVGTGTTFDDERHHTCNHRDDGHQDGAQALLAGLEGGFADAQSLGTALGSEFGDEDGRLREQAYQHDDTRLQVDIVVHARQMEQVA